MRIRQRHRSKHDKTTEIIVGGLKINVHLKRYIKIMQILSELRTYFSHGSDVGSQSSI